MSDIKKDRAFGQSLKKGPRTVFIKAEMDCSNEARLRRYNRLMRALDWVDWFKAQP